MSKLLNENTRLLITGGAGYVGTELVYFLSNYNCKITVLDRFLYQRTVFPKCDNIEVIEGDIRDQQLVCSLLKRTDVVIHLACISNDPSYELCTNFSASVNYKNFEWFAESAKNYGVKGFVNASSSSVYGIVDEANVTEQTKTNPLTPYASSKLINEQILHSIGNNNFLTVSLRPATVCGFSRRLRLDVVVNIFASQAFYDQKIKVFGGEQKRSNIHILDMVSAYNLILNTDLSLINNQVFNVGEENHKILDIAKLVQNLVLEKSIPIEVIESSDKRSYQITCDKIKSKLGFQFQHSVVASIKDLLRQFKSLSREDTVDNPNCYNVQKVKSLLKLGLK